MTLSLRLGTRRNDVVVLGPRITDPRTGRTSRDLSRVVRAPFPGNDPPCLKEESVPSGAGVSSECRTQTNWVPREGLLARALLPVEWVSRSADRLGTYRRRLTRGHTRWGRDIPLFGGSPLTCTRRRFPSARETPILWDVSSLSPLLPTSLTPLFNPQ